MHDVKALAVEGQACDQRLSWDQDLCVPARSMRLIEGGAKYLAELHRKGGTVLQLDICSCSQDG